MQPLIIATDCHYLFTDNRDVSLSVLVYGAVLHEIPLLVSMIHLLLGIYYYPNRCLVVVRKRKVLNESWVSVDGVPVHINVIEGSGCDERMLSRFKRQVDLMLQHDRKVLAIPLTVNFMSQESSNCEQYDRCVELINEGKNTLVSEMIRDFRVYLKSGYGRERQRERVAKGKKARRRTIKINRLGFMWAREFSKKGDYPHYHLWLLIDGSQLKSAFRLTQKLRSIASHYNFTLFYLKGTSWQLDRKDPSLYWSFLYHLSYATKEASKDYTRKSKNANGYDSSKLRPPCEKSRGSLTWKGFQLGCIEQHLNAGKVFTIDKHLDRLTYRSFKHLKEEIAHLAL